MNILLWFFQALMAVTFFYSGICKSYFPEQKLVSMGQTGVEGLPMPFIRFIGISEILGSIGLILPLALLIHPILTSIAAFCFAFMMPFAAWIHYARKEPKNVFLNTIIFLICISIAVGRICKI